MSWSQYWCCCCCCCPAPVSVQPERSNRSHRSTTIISSREEDRGGWVCTQTHSCTHVHSSFLCVGSPQLILWFKWFKCIDKCAQGWARVRTEMMRRFLLTREGGRRRGLELSVPSKCTLCDLCHSLLILQMSRWSFVSAFGRGERETWACSTVWLCVYVCMCVCVWQSREMKRMWKIVRKKKGALFLPNDV